MQINANAPDKILSLLLDVAQCSFVRITEFKKNEHSRHQYGDVNSALLLDENSEVENSFFVTETVIMFGQYQFNVSILGKQHAHIECLSITEQDNVANSRKSSGSLSSNAARIEIELIHKTELPSFIVELSKYQGRKLSEDNTVIVEDDENKWLSTILLKTLYVAVESLQLLEHYVQLTSDSLTKLRSRTALQRGIDEQIVQANVALCMVHCIDFQHVNRKFGQAKGDTVLHEIASVIEQYTRIEDISGRFGGALFGIAIHADSVEDGYTLATKLQTALHNNTYLQNAIRLSFNVGVAFVSQEEDKLDNSSTSSLLINRAEQALKAAQNSANPTIVQWEPDKFRLDEQEFNYLGGIFTADNVTNYRNMLLLWDISSIIADEHTFERLLKSVIERLAFTFEFAYAGIVSLSDTPEKTELARNYSFELKNATDIVDIQWDTHRYRHLVEGAAKLAIENSQHTEHQEDGLNALVIPLGNDTNECFFIMGHNELLDLTHDTVMLFVGFARQLGKAFKRSQLEDQLNKNLEQQNAKLSQELLELKAGMQSSALVYRSAKMQKIVEQTQRAAQTDATVLITGESGTGKEKLINAIHVLSPRNKKPLIIVDCGSIPETLIEAELFGHIKGAFTGAQSDSKGKIQAADGGILVLDEIGELPLSMQPKLLRFVQEKQYTPVGGNKSNVVDVKIVAVTNRDLPYEVSQGKFRKDLYYRLNVVSLHNPPLRERIEDIDLLCQHFLSKFSRQFEMDKKRLSQATIDMMKQYDWPGNIRELENKLMQASLLTTNDEIEFSDLNVELAISQQVPNSQAQLPQQTKSINGQHQSDEVSTIVDSVTEETAYEQAPIIASTPEVWCLEFSETLSQLLSDIDMRTVLDLSLGSTIELMLLHMAHKEYISHAKTAVAMQLPISTARRKLQKPMPNIAIFDNNSNWQTIVKLFSQIVNNQLTLHAPVELVRDLTAQCILKQHASNMALASQLMGVSEPTMYKLRKQLKSHQSVHSSASY
jgi:diguanylate cyclase (GGDEF)-like protein